MAKSPASKPPTLRPTIGGSDKAPHKVWSGTLTFGLISMPVALFTAATEERISFNQLHNACKGRIKQQIFCQSCNAVVPRTDLLKGYETDKDKHVIVSEAELEAAEPASARTMELSEFVPASEIDAIFFESSYYLAPQDGGQKPYALVREAMLRKNVIGVARIVRSGREHICILRPYEQGMVLQALYWNHEVRSMAFPVLPETSQAETAIAEQLIEALAGNWDAARYIDTYRTGLLKLIQAKSEGQEVASGPPKPESKAEVIDIASALKASLAAAKAKKGVA